MFAPQTTSRPAKGDCHRAYRPAHIVIGCENGERRGTPLASRTVEQLRQAGRLKRLCIFIARPMSPAIFSLPLMNAIWPLSLPLIMST